MSAKIKDHHRARPAYIYLRQSTQGQLRHHQESTERQYALRERALARDWPPAMIQVLDGDLGLSGAHSQHREDFKTLVADVSMGKVGALFALEVSRMARSSADWHRLLELCSLTDTLILDEDGGYDLTDFNDQLLLGLKGTMSQAELHVMRARLHGGKLNKARKGELVEKDKLKEVPEKSEYARTFNVFVEGDYFEVGVDEVGGAAAVTAAAAAAAAPAPAPVAAAPAPVPKAAPAQPAVPAPKPAPAAKKEPAPVASAGTPVKAPMPGMIIKYEKNVGDLVNEGETVVVIERGTTEIQQPCSTPMPSQDTFTCHATHSELTDDA